MRDDFPNDCIHGKKTKKNKKKQKKKRKKVFFETYFSRWYSGTCDLRDSATSYIYIKNKNSNTI